MAAKVGSMYVRVKRGTQTVFLHVEPTDSFAVVKQKLGKVRGTECGSAPGWWRRAAARSLVLFAFFVCCPVPSPCSVAVRTRETWRWADAERVLRAARALPAGRARGEWHRGAPMMTYVNNLGTWV